MNKQLIATMTAVLITAGGVVVWWTSSSSDASPPAGRAISHSRPSDSAAAGALAEPLPPEDLWTNQSLQEHAALVEAAQTVMMWLNGTMTPEEYVSHFLALGAPVSNAATVDADEYRKRDPERFPGDQEWADLGNDGRFLANMEYLRKRGPVVSSSDPSRLQTWIGDVRGPKSTFTSGRGVISCLRPPVERSVGSNLPASHVAKLRIPIHFRDQPTEGQLDLTFVYDESLNNWFPSIATISGDGVDLDWTF